MIKTGQGRRKIAILYAEVMGYVIGAIEKYQEIYSDTDILLVELDKKKLTTFKFTCNTIAYFPKSNFSSYKQLFECVIYFDPNVLLVSGRMDSDYLKIAKHLKNKGVYTVTLQDTQYEYSARQYLIALLKKQLYKQYFVGFWGAGDLQVAFGFRLGFKKPNIFRGVYTANTDVYKYCYQLKDRKEKIFFSVGRLSPEKNMIALAEAIEAVNDNLNTNHKLLIAGDGLLKKRVEKFKCVEVLGFLSSNSIVEISKRADIFCLPSLHDPWGVVIHEFAAMGFPMLVSSECGAGSMFVLDGYNGFVFCPRNSHSIEQAVHRFVTLDIAEYNIMSRRSEILSKRQSSILWAATLRSISDKALNSNKRE